jgi:hypothetical protein
LPPEGRTSGGGGGIPRCAIEHPYILVAFYLGVALLAVGR